MDIAFTQMFGGFSQEFYDVYNAVYPLEPGFSKRVGLYNLYPYLVHLNLFGRSYFGHIDSTVRQFT
jgi:fructosamine-3-kinase